MTKDETDSEHLRMVDSMVMNVIKNKNKNKKIRKNVNCPLRHNRWLVVVFRIK